MSETAPAAPGITTATAMEKLPAKKQGRRQAGVAPMCAKPKAVSVSKLIPEALSASSSRERTGMSLAALKKALAAVGYDVERNNSRIKGALRSLVSKGVLVQTRGTGASGSFRLSRRAAPDGARRRARLPAARPGRTGASPEQRSPRGAKGVRKPKAPAAKAAAGRGRKAPADRGAPPRRSPAKAKAANPKAGRPKLALKKSGPRKATARK